MDENRGYSLCLAYDLVASELEVEGDEKELAINHNGKRRFPERDILIMISKNTTAGENNFHKRSTNK